jgi:glycosyltransferase involved in cell wall biosynthesis
LTHPPLISVVIPALNEEASIGKVIREIFASGLPGRLLVYVVDNGSEDRTADCARAAGAQVVFEPQRGYGAACLAGIAAAGDETDIFLFIDADGSDDPAEAPAIVAPLLAGHADLVLGSRILGRAEGGALTLQQRFGNWLAVSLMRLIWEAQYTDLGPFRAISRRALERLNMADRDFGWTIEMQVRAARMSLAILERPAAYRRRIGRSKISGTVSGVVRAGCKILYVIAREALSAPQQPESAASASPKG